MDDYVKIASELVEKREKYQRVLGEVATLVTKNFGSNALKTLSEEVENTTGRRISVSTLRNYRWVYERTSILNLPDDLSYHTLQLIASTDSPEEWAQKIANEGLSSPQVARLLMKKREKTVTCPMCEHIFNG